MKTIINFPNYKINKEGKVYLNNEKEKAPSKCKKGYLHITLSRFGIKKTFLVHRLTALSFIPNPNNLPQVNHKDGNKLNNCIDNLEWCTCSENLKHAFSLGLSKANNEGAKNPKAKLTENDVLEIKALIKSKFIPQNKIAKMYNIDATVISGIKKGTKWKNI